MYLALKNKQSSSPIVQIYFLPSSEFYYCPQVFLDLTSLLFSPPISFHVTEHMILRSSFFAPFIVGALSPVFKSFLFQELILGNLLTCSCITVITLGLLWFYWFGDFVYISSTDLLQLLIITAFMHSPHMELYSCL